MEVIINQNPFQANSNTLLEVLLSYGIKNTKGVAVAINNKVVPKSRWSFHELKPNDCITIIKAAQGG